jgi:hypothetical protein
MGSLVPTAEEVKKVKGYLLTHAPPLPPAQAAGLAQTPAQAQLHAQAVSALRASLAGAERWVLAVVDADESYSALARAHGQPAPPAGASMATATAFESALQAAAFSLEFTGWARALDDSLDVVLRAQTTLRVSPHTQTVLGAALAVGNVLNSLTDAKAGAYGVRLKDLARLGAVKVDATRPAGKPAGIAGGAGGRAAKPRETGAGADADADANADADADAGGSAAPDTAVEVEPDTEVEVTTVDPVTGAVTLDLSGPRTPLPPRASLAHFLARLLARRVPALGELLAPTAAAFATAARIDQAAVAADVAAITGQAGKFAGYVAGLRARAPAMAAVIAAADSAGDSVNGTSATVAAAGAVGSAAAPTADWVALARAEAAALARVAGTEAYTEARVGEIRARFARAAAQGAELAAIFSEPDARAAWEHIFSLWGDVLAMLATAHGEIGAEVAKRVSAWRRQRAAEELRSRNAEKERVRAAAAAAAAAAAGEAGGELRTPVKRARGETLRRAGASARAGAAVAAPIPTVPETETFRYSPVAAATTERGGGTPTATPTDKPTDSKARLQPVTARTGPRSPLPGGAKATEDAPWLRRAVPATAVAGGNSAAGSDDSGSRSRVGLVTPPKPHLQQQQQYRKSSAAAIVGPRAGTGRLPSPTIKPTPVQGSPHKRSVAERTAAAIGRARTDTAAATVAAAGAGKVDTAADASRSAANLTTTTAAAPRAGAAAAPGCRRGSVTAVTKRVTVRRGSMSKQQLQPPQQQSDGASAEMGAPTVATAGAAAPGAKKVVAVRRVVVVRKVIKTRGKAAIDAGADDPAPGQG